MKLPQLKINGVLQTLAQKANENSPTILTGLAVAGLVGTTVMAVKATPKACKVIERLRYERDEYEIPKKDIIKETWKLYIPTICMAGATIACIIGANTINLRRNAAIASAYGFVEKSLKEYEERVKEVHGDEGWEEVKRAQYKRKLEDNPIVETDIKESEVVLNGGKDLVFDVLSGRYFYSDIETIKSVMNDLSRQLLSDMTITLNELYGELGLDAIKMGDNMGWNVNRGLIEPIFTTQLASNGRPCLVMDFDIAPRFMDNDY